MSVIIPTLDAARGLRRSLPALAAFDGLDLICEVVFVDGGSTDETAAIAEAAGARFLAAPRGRGQQLRAGGAAARGSWLLFLHADTVLADGWAAAVRAFIVDDTGSARAGYFRFALDDAGGPARLLERAVAVRSGVLRLPYGDQGLLISRRLYDAVGGFRPIPLMEDIDLVRRLGRRRLAPLGVRAVTSAERYRRDGYLRRSMRNLLCLSLYYVGVPPRLIAKIYG